ncbi:benzoate-CoA ligase family protein [Derxia gummosa]|uniref:Benzoate-CoA ligase family protein n=1 Tax=Derxia gummosa DSM 723 TaxID=1121388 RepID=A0A8B6X496_9BURK|nr:benzoate-CoA ligase family protein [Derxia gummosa]
MSTPHAAPPERFNFAAHLMALNAGRAAKPAYIDDRGTLSYGRLADGIRRFAGALAALDIRREERVLLALPDTRDWPVAFLGALYAGVVPVAVNTLLTAADYAYMLGHCRAQAIITSESLVPAFREAMAATAGNEVRHVIVASETDEPARLGPGFHDLRDLLAAATPRADAAHTARDDIAFWLYSSGSTGKPKGTVHTHANPWWTAELYGREVLRLAESDIVFSAAKLFFAYGLGNGLTFPLSVGATVVLLPGRPTPDAVFRRLVDHKPTVFYGVPTLFASMLASPDAPAADQVALRLCASAGEALPKEIGERFTQRYGAKILDGIGSTEMLHIFLSNRADDLRYGSTGKPVPGYELELRGDDGRPVPRGEVGDLYIKGPSAALMYWTNREKSCCTFVGEWLKSGDKYFQDADGYYVYAGRSDDMLKVSGLYVSPFEVEAALIEHPSVLEAAVIGKVDHDQLVKTKAFVVLKGGLLPTPELEAEIKAFVKERLAPFKYPRYLEFVKELPKTATGKIQRFKLREREANGAANEAA